VQILRRLLAQGLCIRITPHPCEDLKAVAVQKKCGRPTDSRGRARDHHRALVRHSSPPKSGS
jgi:hypothetical protein